ncbi:MAG: hypothetical protein ACTSWN_14725 [Promethearchaeota archaeon]
MTFTFKWLSQNALIRDFGLLSSTSAGLTSKTPSSRGERSMLSCH